MRNLQRRLLKLEARITDSHGLVAGTPEWLEFWSEKIERVIAGEEVDLRGMSIAVVDAMIEAAERESIDTLPDYRY